jgi:hypothetical protein
MRKLLVGTDTAVAYTAGVLDAGAIDVQKQTAAGSVTKLAADTIAQAPKIRLVQGTPEGKNIVTPWLDGTNVVAWKKESYAPQVAQVSTCTMPTAGVFTAAGIATVKLIGLNQGQAQFERKSYTIEVGPGTTVLNANDFAVELAARITNDRPSFVDTAVAAIVGPNEVVTITGTTFSLTASPSTELGNFRLSDEGLAGNGVVNTIDTIVQPTLGVGSAEVLAQYEKSLQGDRSFYNRVTQPNTPPSYIDTVGPTDYDVYSIVVANGTEGQIKGVDNLRSITVAFKNSGGAASVAFELTLNNWMISLPGAFPNV